MVKKIFFLLLVVNHPLLLAQSQFQQAIGGISREHAYSIVQTTGGGYVVAGYTGSFGAGNRDVYIVKFDADGTSLWSRAVGGTNIDEAYSIIQTSDGGFAVPGQTNSFGSGLLDMFIVKLDTGGLLQWSKTIGEFENDGANSIVQTSDGGYAVAGYSFSFGIKGPRLYIVKFDASGALKWNRSVGGTAGAGARSIAQTTDGGFVAAGWTNSFGGGVNNNMYIVKLDSSGTHQWSQTIGGAENDQVNSIIQTSDGGFAAAGYTASFGAGNSDMYIAKLDSSGMLQWSRTIGGTDYDIATSIIQTTDGGFAVAGYTGAFAAYDYCIVKLNSSGTLQWSKAIGGSGDDGAYSIFQTTDGGFAVAGYTNSFGTGSGDFYIVKLDSSGNTCGNTASLTSIATVPSPTMTTPVSMVMTPSPAITSPAPTVSFGGTVTEICSLVGIGQDADGIPASFDLLQNYPNPFNTSTIIQFTLPRTCDVVLRIFNIYGREVETLVTEPLREGVHTVTWNANNVPTGIYLCRLQTGRESKVTRLVLVK
jgi:hypothetical protein